MTHKDAAAPCHNHPLPHTTMPSLATDLADYRNVKTVDKSAQEKMFKKPKPLIPNQTPTTETKPES